MDKKCTMCPKEGGITIIPNTNGEIVPTRPVTWWRVCVEYRKLNSLIGKNDFPLSFINKMLDKLLETWWYCFLNDYSGYKPLL